MGWPDELVGDFALTAMAQGPVQETWAPRVIGHIFSMIRSSPHFHSETVPIEFYLCAIRPGPHSPIRYTNRHTVGPLIVPAGNWKDLSGWITLELPHKIFHHQKIDLGDYNGSPRTSPTRPTEFRLRADSVYFDPVGS
jgi:hypothetical protein